MTLGIKEEVRNAMLDEIAAAINAGAGAGLLRVYDGSRPATGGTATTLLAELTFSDPCAAAAASGVLTFSAITKDSSANATGTASWCRAVDSTGAFVFDGSVTATGGGGDYELSTTSIASGNEVTCTSGTITAGNA
jgi:hypothetical protein